MELNSMQRRTWAEIDLDALEYNYKVLREHIPQSAKMCCVVKADAYGHGAAKLSKMYEELGADFLAVSNIKEALNVREAGVKLPILVLGYTDPACAMILAQHRISQCVYSCEYGKALAKEAIACGVKISIHIKVDVGMGRIGFVFRDSDGMSYKEVLEICKQPCFFNEGIFTHFPLADAGEGGREITQMQYDSFCKTVKKLEENGVRFYIRHCSNSAAGINYPQYSLDMVRFGIALYGAADVDKEQGIELKDTVSLKTVITNLKLVKRGDTVGYGSEFVAQKDSIIATLPIGYADGFKRENFTNGTRVFVNGTPCPITGRICMDYTMIDVSEASGVKFGDEVIIYGKGTLVSITDFSQNNKTIPYETMCEIGARVPRAYIKGGKIDFVRDPLV